jgi:hypothetical protein
MTRPETNPQCYKLSASSIASFKACPTRFRLSYREGLRLIEDTEAQRVGTNWHGIHEVYRNSWMATDSDKPDVRDARALDDVVNHLNQRYDKVPAWSDPISWDLERQILLTSFIGYMWYYSEDVIEYLAQEIKFDLPLRVPSVGMNVPMTEAVRVGKIDHLINWDGMVGVLERKSTTKDIDPSSDYWQRSQKDTQVSMYSLAVTDLFEAGKLPLEDVSYKRLGNTLYDVWRRPTTKPKNLTQKDTREFLDTGRYCDQEFNVTTDTKMDGYHVWVDGVAAEVTVGKKDIAIRETVAMYAARLLTDITERPERYFQRKEIVRTAKELDKFRIELYNIYVAQKTYQRTGCWWENENQCRATFTCQYVPICYGQGADAVCDGKTTPPNFRRIFVDPTVEGQTINEGE